MGWAQAPDDHGSDGGFDQVLSGFDYRRRQVFAQEVQDKDESSGHRVDENLKEEIRACEAALEDEIKRMRADARVSGISQNLRASVTSLGTRNSNAKNSISNTTN